MNLNRFGVGIEGGLCFGQDKNKIIKCQLILIKMTH